MVRFKKGRRGTACCAPANLKIMKAIKVNLKENSYRVLIGPGILDNLGVYLKQLDIGTDAYIITNSSLKSLFGESVNKALLKSGFTFYYKLVPDSEKSKAFSVAGRILSDLSAYGLNKKLFILALGGGVIGDLAGFAASIYRRGIPYIQIPTSLLAQVDSSIGGKTAVDLSCGKNLVGTFYQPKLVLSDIGLLRFLPSRQLKSALAEVIKYAVIGDRELFVYLENNLAGILAKDKTCLEYIVARCAGIKAGIVSRDEKEKKGIRVILNFGHTLGHAIEAAGKFKAYNHGEAVGLGMLAACGISRRMGLLKDSHCQRIEDLIKSAGLPTRIKGLEIKKILGAHYHDKKFKGAVNKFVLLERIGKCIVKENIPLEIIKEALTRISG